MHLLRTWRITLVCFWESKSDYLLPTGKVPTPLCLTHRARASARPSPSCTLRSIFGPVKEKTTWLTRTHCQTTSDISPQQWGGRSQSTREPWTQETIVRRKDGGAVTCSVLIIFRGQRRLAAFPHAAGESWLPSLPHRHLSEQGREGNPGSWTSSLWALLTCSGCPWLVTLKLSAYSACITCVSKDSKRTLPSQWALAASAGGAVRLYLMVRKAQNFYQPKTFLFPFASIIMEFSNSLLGFV